MTAHEFWLADLRLALTKPFNQLRYFIALWQLRTWKDGS